MRENASSLKSPQFLPSFFFCTKIEIAMVLQKEVLLGLLKSIWESSQLTLNKLFFLWIWPGLAFLFKSDSSSSQKVPVSWADKEVSKENSTQTVEDAPGCSNAIHPVKELFESNNDDTEIPSVAGLSELKQHNTQNPHDSTTTKENVPVLSLLQIAQLVALPITPTDNSDIVENNDKVIISEENKDESLSCDASLGTETTIYLPEPLTPTGDPPSIYGWTAQGNLGEFEGGVNNADLSTGWQIQRKRGRSSQSNIIEQIKIQEYSSKKVPSNGSRLLLSTQNPFQALIGVPEVPFTSHTNKSEKPSKKKKRTSVAHENIKRNKPPSIVHESCSGNILTDEAIKQALSEDTSKNQELTPDTIPNEVQDEKNDSEKPIKKCRKRKKASKAKTVESKKKAFAPTPFKDTAEAWRLASCPPRPQPKSSSQVPNSEWQVQGRKHSYSSR